MDDYRRKVRQLALARSGEPFFNASEDHAAIIVENVFKTAQSEVCIFSAHLAPRIYGRTPGVEWATIFLADDDNHALRVVVKEGELPVLAANPLYEAVKSFRNVRFHALPDAMHDELPYRFLVADSESYRFEPDHTKCEAVAAFGAKDAANKLQGVFESLWNLSSPVNLDKLETMHPSLAE